jgi:hypothetical protein
MEMTLYQLQSEISINGGLKVTKEVVDTLKKKGWIFFETPLCELTEFQPFHLYLYEFPGSSTEINAFPIPKSMFGIERLKNIKERIYEGFEKYYSEPLRDHFSIEEYLNCIPYVGEEYVWFYRERKEK